MRVQKDKLKILVGVFDMSLTSAFDLSKPIGNIEVFSTIVVVVVICAAIFLVLRSMKP
ncbi:hypothetical protein [Helicobacter sp. 13S00401-1]|uniref:hypothetical protein n=1 Tax=Helicobacter sp. 13S00401-1 TaxID=1905758 RepID=UPI001553018E|nr:hypothetical protein [Helicobacter sp. 13S00401-1]